jgi:hypothetical protein
MRGADLLNAAVGARLDDGRLQSFYLRGELATRICATFLRFDSWLRIVSTDEMTKVDREDELFGQISAYGDEEYRYPIEPISRHFPKFSRYLGKRLLDWRERVLQRHEAFSFGLSLFFEEDLCLVIHNHDYPIDRQEYYFEHSLPDHLKEVSHR